MMISLVVSGLIGLGAGWVIGMTCRKRRKVVLSEPEIFVPEYSFDDLIHLAETNGAADVNALFVEYKVGENMPEFYRRYLRLSKQNRDRYYSVLLELLNKDWMGDRPDTVLSTQDTILLMMDEMKLDNKTMAKVLGVQADTLKKRKTRLRMKVNLSETEEKAEFPEPPESV